MITTTALVTPRFEPDKCANCFEPLPDDSQHRPWLYCSLLCRETANTIRYWRNTSRNGLLQADPLVREAIATRLGHMLAGGYNATDRRIPTAVRVLVIERDRGCVRCGKPGEEVDHIDGDSSDPGNLQLLCGVCHRAKTRSHMVPASEDQSAVVPRRLIYRVVPDQPAFLCDDEESWQNVERRLRSERLIRLRTSAAYLREQEKAETEVAQARAAEVIEGGDEDDDDPRGDDYYAGFGENSHYTEPAGWNEPSTRERSSRLP